MLDEAKLMYLRGARVIEGSLSLGISTVAAILEVLDCRERMALKHVY